MNKTTTTFEDDGLTGATTYTYIILAATGDGPVMSVGNTSVTTSTTGGSVPSGPLSNLQAIGVNDLEVLITWNAPTQPPIGYEIQESADGVHGWSYVAEVNRSTATSCLVRGCGVNGSGFMQEGVTYYFRVGQILTYLNGASVWSAAVPAMVRIPDGKINRGKDMIVICAGRNGNMTSMLQGVNIRHDNSGLPLEGGSGLAMLWVDLIDKGFNAFLVPDPEDGGSFSPTGEPGVDYIFPADETHLESTLNNDGSGRIYDEIQYEFSKGIYNLGLIGYSHGAGMTENISNRLWTDPQTPSVFVVGDVANVKFAATVEGIKYGTGVEGYTEHGAMTVSPAAKWAGYGFNYWTPNGASLLNVHGGPLTGAHNYPPYLLFNHVTIQTSSAFTSVENDVINIYGSLP